MKNVFGLEKRTEKFDGEKFIVRRAEGELAAKQDRLEKDKASFERMAGLPTWVNVCGMILLLLGAVFLCGFLEALEDVTFAQAWENAGWCFVVGLAALAAGGVILLVAFVKRKRAQQTPAYRYLQETVEKVAKESFEAFGVPASAQTIDVIAVAYKGKEGKEYKENAFTVTYVNAEAKVYRENEALFFAFFDCVFALPLSNILRIQCINKRIAAEQWNKPEPVRKNRYKDFKVIKDNNGRYSTKPYYRMVVRDEAYEEYAVLIPCYDVDVVLSLTGKTVEG